ncbi:MAG TPA: IS3 family transposase [Myxococcota bacterium]|nr:IS3 family transposase [Myxococcota bacterium]
MSDKIEKKQEQPLKAVPEADRGSSGAEGGRSPTGGPSEPRRREQRWSARKKQDLVLRLLRGESLDAVSRETGLPVSRIAGWRDASLSAMEHSLKASSHRQRDDLAQDKRELQRKLGEVTMDNELLREKIRKLEEKHPFPWGRSKR